ncbi:natural resistance-associated macrophage protein [Pluteus cervinus]|uniref:Natural resistance-associated macrophage protein n=1 Tax=Pluteus cervinus TaxID=181527 RepID=A0ACD3BGX2_9AGAR|nr:natural resistance-associated macrophage protein [Pluteus cervinus]
MSSSPEPVASSSSSRLDPPPPAPPKSKISAAVDAVTNHAKHHVGVGIICAVAYFDPGNWSVDLEAGSRYGYRPMLFVILMAGLGAIVLQLLACRLGVVTGLDLASHCRLLLYNHPKHPRLVRRLVLYPLYVLAEIAIISTDLAELLGSAIGLCLLFPKLPLWGGVVITAGDVLFFLAFSDTSGKQSRPARIFEATIVALVFAVFGCFVALIVQVHPKWADVFLGYIPSKALFQSAPGAVYSAVGILGATIMPHALFLGSSLATQDRVSIAPVELELPQSAPPKSFKGRLYANVKSLFSVRRADRVAAERDYRSPYGQRENNSYTFIKQHLSHGIVDIVSSLMLIAVPINSAILILAATVFYKGPGMEHETPGGLFDAHELITSHIGKGAGMLFAIALLCAGQTSSITATLAGQIVSEGFIEWKISPFLRRLVTRLISLIPSVAVAVAVGRDGINDLLVASQVVLSVVLPFVAFPLIYLTSSEVVMRVRKPRQIVDADPTLDDDDQDDGTDLPEDTQYDENMKGVPVQVQEVVRPARRGILREIVDYSNGRWMSWLAYMVWAVVLVANTYAIAMLALEKSDED